jgi:alpha-tubulin suppressor-like RCC1 family protein
MGQIGDGTSSYRLFPTIVNTSTTLGELSKKRILQIYSGFAHTCTISNDLKLYCWGKNELILFFFNEPFSN